MRSLMSRLALVVCLGGGALGLTAGAPVAWARPKEKKPGPAAGAGSDSTLDKQSAWEQKVMGDDGAKRADLKKIAAAQRLGDDARKNPPPEPPKRYKDPNKEGARAKSEASIGLPIASDEARRPSGKKTAASGPKRAAPASSSNDELGALVASSLASDRKASAPAAAPPPPAAPEKSRGRGRGGKARGKAAKAAKAAPAAPAGPSSLDRMFAAGK